MYVHGKMEADSWVTNILQMCGIINGGRFKYTSDICPHVSKVIDISFEFVNHSKGNINSVCEVILHNTKNSLECFCSVKFGTAAPSTTKIFF